MVFVRFYFFHVPTAPELSGGENKSLKDASRKLEIHASPESGNYAVAKENIIAGDVLIVEQPIASCLLPKYFSTHCHHCLKRHVSIESFQLNTKIPQIENI